MQAKDLRSSLSARARHGKRLPQVSDSDPLGGVTNIPGPITITVTEIRLPPASQSATAPITPTVTVFVPPSPSSSAPVPSSPPVVVTTSSQSTTTSITQPPLPSASAKDNGSNNDTSQSGATSKSQGIPTGAVVGIVLAVSLIIIAAGIFLIRKRSVRNRLRLRGWTNSKGPDGPSFLWIEPRETKITPYPNMGSTFQSRGSMDPSPVRAQPQVQLAPLPVGTVLPYIPPPAPPRPPPAHGTEGDYYGPMSPVSIPAALTPGTGSSVTRKPPPSSTPASPWAATTVTVPPAEMAEVRSTFIPTLPDELPINTGEVIYVQAEYDDGWALCSNARGESGMVPLECLDRGRPSQADEAREYKKLARASSLAAGPYGGYY